MRRIFSIANSQITFLNQENFQLKVKQLLQRKHKLDLEEDECKGKKIIEFGQIQDMETKT